MLNLKYIGDNTVYIVEFSTISNNVIELRGDFPIKTDGFVLSRIGHNDYWNYSAYSTVYRETENSVQFSNNGSVYTELEQVFPETELYEPTPEELAAQEQYRKEQEAIPTNSELAEALLELAENISFIEEAISKFESLK